ncbi:hypothetical protein G6F43_003674 [Rhizopus delemar]|nr:hypothetical protein G6F43_003674 [Rhizopus delemar]
MKRPSLLLLSYLFIWTVESLDIQHPKLKQKTSDVIPGRYMIEFNQNDLTFFTQSFRQDDTYLKVNHQYNHDFFHGLSININTEDDEAHKNTLESILNRGDVQSVSPVRRIPRPEATIERTGIEANLILPHHMTQVDLVHTELKNKGKGILVGVLDTGVDYMLPALGGGFGKGYKVVTGYDLVGDQYNGDNTPVPDPDPLDACGVASGASGHGTHVSGIIAGEDASINFVGVAPEANLAMYRVFGCEGTTGDDVIVNALLMAYDAGADVINLSLGSTNPWSDASDPEIKVVNQIVSKGVHVVISAGNSGEDGAYTLSSPSSARLAFSVASVENDFYNTTTLLASGFDLPIVYSLSSGFDPLAKLVSGELALAAKVDNPTDDACQLSDVSESVKGKVALVKRGNCTFTEKVNNAAAAGALSVIIYDDTDESLSGASTPNTTIASVRITLADGLALIAAAGKETVNINFDAGYTVVPVSDGGAVSSFSSMGPSAELIFKPNIAGVGGHVFSTLPRYLGGWGLMSGTSMASPYVAGSIALYIHAHGKKEKEVQFVQEQFQNYASPRRINKSQVIDSPIRAGAGLVQVYDTITQCIHVSPSQISFNDTSSHKNRKQSFTVTNNGNVTVQYRLTQLSSTGVAPYNLKVSGYTPIQPAANMKANANLLMSKKDFTLAPGESAEIKVTVVPPNVDSDEHIYYGGYIILNPLQAGKEVRIPYIGVKGKQKDLPIFDNGYPYVSDGNRSYGIEDTYIYDRTRARNTPYTVYRLLTPTRYLKAELIHVNTGKLLGFYKTGLDYLSRHFLDEANYYSTIRWTGTYVPTSYKETLGIPAPAGVYQFRLSALKLFGDPDDASDWEVYTSGPIVLRN